MNINYFSDTDTAYVRFNDHEVSETCDINSNVCIDIDAQGNVIGLTIEHAKDTANIEEVVYRQTPKRAA